MSEILDDRKIHRHRKTPTGGVCDTNDGGDEKVRIQFLKPDVQALILFLDMSFLVVLNTVILRKVPSNKKSHKLPCFIYIPKSIVEYQLKVICW